jgi:hypothetical protein
MRQRPLVLAAFALSAGLSGPAYAETSCELANAAPDRIVTVRGKIKSIDTDRGDKSYWVVVELEDQCGTADVSVSTKESPRCRVGTNVWVAGHYKGAAERLLEAQRIVCVK